VVRGEEGDYEVLEYTEMGKKYVWVFVDFMDVCKFVFLKSEDRKSSI
jgi:hypothetical protein